MNLQGFPTPALWLSNLGVNPIYGSFVPEISFATPGDVSVAYTIQEGEFVKIGNLVWFSLRVAGTPTYSTAVGSVRIGPLPFTPTVVIPGRFVCELITSGVAWPASTTQMFGIVIGGSDLLGIECQGPGATRNPFATGQFPSGSARDVIMNGLFLTT